MELEKKSYRVKYRRSEDEGRYVNLRNRIEFFFRTCRLKRINRRRRKGSLKVLLRACTGRMDEGHQDIESRNSKSRPEPDDEE